MGFLKVASIFYFVVALAIGFTHDAPSNNGTPIADSVEHGLIWPWFVIEFFIEET